MWSLNLEPGTTLQFYSDIFCSITIVQNILIIYFHKGFAFLCHESVLQEKMLNTSHTQEGTIEVVRLTKLNKS